MKQKKISKLVLSRLPVYLNYLKSLPEECEHVSATSISRALGFGEVLVRKDLAQTSGEGKPKRGYPRKRLIADIEEFLNFSEPAKAIIIGAGKLGQALLDYSGFEEYGLSVVAAFDARCAFPQTESKKPIYPVEELKNFCKKHTDLIGIITVPADNAQTACDLLVSCGVRAIWNFAPVHLHAPSQIRIQNENLAISLAVLRLQPACDA